MQKLTLRFGKITKLQKIQKPNVIILESLNEFSKYKNSTRLPKIINFDIIQQQTYYKLVKSNARFIYLKNVRFINLKLLKNLRYITVFIVDFNYILRLIYQNQVRVLRDLKLLYYRLQKFSQLYVRNDTNKIYSTHQIDLIFGHLELKPVHLMENNLFFFTIC